MRLFLCAFCVAILPSVTWANKSALVIGNAAYTAVSALENPGNDARAISKALTEQGFDVVTAIDVTRSEFYDSLRDFRDIADQSEVALVYYAGHGIEIGGQNYLVPVDARLTDERDAEVEMVNMSTVLRQISGASTLKMVVLDACRDNPFATAIKSENRGSNVGRGLAVVSNAESATLVAYAAAAGEVTPDGTGNTNSPFTRAFLKALAQPPSDVRLLLGSVRDEMSTTVPGAVPFVYSSLGAQEIVINPNSALPEPEVVAQPEPEGLPELDQDALLRDFAAADFAGSVEAWDLFLDRYQEHASNMLYIVALRNRKQLDDARLAHATSSPEVSPTPQTEQRTTANDVEPAEQVAALAQPGPIQPSPTLGTNGVVDTAKPAEAETQAVLEATKPQPVEPTRTVPELKRALQAALRERGCYRSSIDGIWGSGSAKSIDRFNAVAGMDLRIGTNSSAEEFEAVLAGVQSSGASVRCTVAAAKPETSRTKTPNQESSRSNSAAQTVPKLPNNISPSQNSTEEEVVEGVHLKGSIQANKACLNRRYSQTFYSPACVEYRKKQKAKN